MWLGKRDRTLPDRHGWLTPAFAKNLLRVSGLEQGGAMVELALCVPIMMLMVTGVYSIGTLLQQDMQLTDSVNVGAMYLGSRRGQSTDPCLDAINAIKNSSPFLDTTLMHFTIVLNGTSYVDTTGCSGATYTSGGPGNMVSGKTATVTVTYPCNVSVYMQPIIPNCTLSASLSEVVQ